jgi:hypothetical protein
VILENHELQNDLNSKCRRMFTEFSWKNMPLPIFKIKNKRPNFIFIF